MTDRVDKLAREMAEALAAAYQKGAPLVGYEGSRYFIDAGVAAALLRPHIAALVEEADRLRRQNHAFASEQQKRCAKDHAELADLRSLMKQSREVHEDDMRRQGKPVWSEISGYGQGAAAILIKRAEEAEAKLAAVTGWRDRLHVALCHVVLRLKVVASEAEEALDQALGPQDNTKE